VTEKSPEESIIDADVSGAGSPSKTSISDEPSTPKQEIIQRLEPYVQPGRADEAAMVVQSMLVQQSHSGPLPSSREFRGYNTVLPGAADRILRMAEREQEHRQSLETKVVHDDLRLKGRGQVYSLAALALMLAVVVVFGLLGHPVEGAAIGTAIIVAVIAIFHGQKWFPKKPGLESAD